MARGGEGAGREEDAGLSLVRGEVKGTEGGEFGVMKDPDSRR